MIKYYTGKYSWYGGWYFLLSNLCCYRQKFHLGKITLHLNITPDGFCDHRTGVVNTEMMKSVNELLKSVNSAIFGRTTYQLFESYWPIVWKEKKGSDEDIMFSGLMDNMEKIVFTRTLTNTEWKNSRIIRELNKQEILKIKDQSEKDIIVFGSPGLASQLIELDLVDDYYFLVQPFVAGGGPRLFYSQPNAKRKLQFKNAQSFESGVVILHYGLT
ncbi:MAG TPA: dihydrofolate reductase family protein [Puia sp.]